VGSTPSPLEGNKDTPPPRRSRDVVTAGSRVAVSPEPDRHLGRELFPARPPAPDRSGTGAAGGAPDRCDEGWRDGQHVFGVRRRLRGSRPAATSGSWPSSGRCSPRRRRTRSITSRTCRRSRSWRARSAVRRSRFSRRTVGSIMAASGGDVVVGHHVEDHTVHYRGTLSPRGDAIEGNGGSIRVPSRARAGLRDRSSSEGGTDEAAPGVALNSRSAGVCRGRPARRVDTGRSLYARE
jgi:hypothetical protein